jgi:excisionase family DNA binding protein
MADLRNPMQPDRRHEPRGGRRAGERQVDAWSTGTMADCIGMSSDFVRREIEAGELKASRFGREYRIQVDEVRRYLLAKQFPIPDSLH